ncbi:RNA-dependent RNA polymerase L [Almpiwar virus]|uniref:Replicase n=2 Tax=Almpiwar virus TaxID=318843 RepID=A0A024A262_9RHAB|nr:RNA-dependent RNA polymerase L [Almpiwar virus]AHY85660.1 RNA-dependent RNA polymerase L [Almpiwar virus]
MLFEEDDVFGADESIFSEYGDWDEEIYDDPNKGLYTLSSSDYNLDSPIIIDKIHNFYLFLTNQQYSQLFDQGDFNLYESFLKKEKINIINIKNPLLCQNFIGDYLLKPVSSTGEWVKLLKKVISDTNSMKELNDSFLRELGLRSLQDMEYISSSTINNYGSKFLCWYKIILGMNNINCKRGIFLNDVTSLTFTPNESHKKAGCLRHYFTGKMQDLGQVIVTKDFVYLKDYHELISRDFALMIKDLLAGRIMCLLDLKIKGRNDSTLLKFFKEGDKLLRTYRNDSYKIFKMIEPVCNNTLTKNGSELIPEFPKFTTFDTYINQETNQLIQEFPASKEFLETVKYAETMECIDIYGCYRLFGHPIIDYFKGLQDLYDLTHSEKVIDEEFVQNLASDLAYMVLEKKFREDKKWYVDKKKIKPSHPLYEYISQSAWPPSHEIQAFGDKWHKLPLIKCFDIPDFIDPSELYSDKSHSIGYSELVDHLIHKPNTPIPTKRVLTSLLNNPDTNWTEFLSRVNEYGFELEELIIGLRAKERELKIKGRFFALMSWALREYFVITEWLIKQHFLPLFEGLTMADDLNTVITKMINKTTGHDHSSCTELITICNHLDYEKWNNNQRGKSNDPVFKVMGQFLGYPNLITRTHEVFEKSFIYFVNRPDMMVSNGTDIASKDKLVCWKGQLGGLEGLRQKGWTITSMLMLLRLPKSSNTLVRTLAQGDNQIVVTTYRPKHSLNQMERNSIYLEIYRNNNNIMKEVRIGATRLGLHIKEEECMQSIGYLNYGKIIVLRGVIFPVITKRICRINSLSNDQLPTMANVLSTVGSNILTISHFHIDLRYIFTIYSFFINFSRVIWELFDCIIGKPVPGIPSSPDNYLNYIISVAYQDPSIGGVCGLSLTRFLIRSFPDPVTESLTFWKIIYDNTENKKLKGLCVSMGNPKLNSMRVGHFKKLLENPGSINLAGGMSPAILLKDAITSEMQKDKMNYRNQIIVDSLKYYESEGPRLIDWLREQRPWYPKFQSEFYSSTFMGIVESHVGMFQNARTIRNCMKMKIEKRFNEVIMKCESQNISYNTRKINTQRLDIWTCSAERADELRSMSWGQKIYGITIPHPAEMMGKTGMGGLNCEICISGPQPFISTLVIDGFPQDVRRGRFRSYLGSRTRESTSLTNPWEKETKIPIIKRAAHLRVSIGWFVSHESPIADMIYQNLKALTGEDWSVGTAGKFKRTGTAQHRYGCSRQSQGGYCAQNPVISSHMITTTDTLGEWAATNYDFMFQATILYCQLLTFTRYQHLTDGFSVHHHFKCLNCIREVDEVEIDCSNSIGLPDVSNVLKGWMTGEKIFSENKITIEIPEANLDHWTQDQLNFQIGFTTGFLFGHSVDSRSIGYDESALFPLGMKKKINPVEYTEGLVFGIMVSSAIHLVTIRPPINKGSTKTMLKGHCHTVITYLTDSEAFQAMCRGGPMLAYFESFQHKIPASYPLNNHDLGLILNNGLKTICNNQADMIYEFKTHKVSRVIIFPETNDSKLISSISLGVNLLSELCKQEIPSQELKSRIKIIKELIINLSMNQIPRRWIYKNTSMSTVNQEIRHLLKERPYTYQVPGKGYKWGSEYVCKVDICYIEGSTEKSTLPDVQIPRWKNILMSAIRLGQIATGSHYKIRSVLTTLKLSIRDAICAGDGSGGIGALILRMYPLSRVVFNSLLDLTNSDLKGSKPSPPSAIDTMGPLKTRCVNLEDVWEYSSDLSQVSTWNYFVDLKTRHHMSVNLMTLDMQVQTEDIQEKIDILFCAFAGRILEKKCTVIYKTYVHRLIKPTNIVNRAWEIFSSIAFARTELSSTLTSEIYIIFQNLSSRNKNYYPHWSNVTPWIMNSYCFKDPKSELKRARKFIGENLLIGIPKNLISNPEMDIAELLQILGVTNRVSLLISEMIEQFLYIRPSDTIHAAVALAGKFIFNALKSDKPPSNTTVENIILIHIGFWTYLAYLTNDLELYKLTNAWTNIYGWIHFNPGTSWSFNKGRRCKTVRVDTRISIAQHLTRSLLKMHNDSFINEDVDGAEHLTRAFCSRWSVQHIHLTSGSFEWKGPWSYPKYINYLTEDVKTNEACDVN